MAAAASDTTMKEGHAGESQSPDCNLDDGFCWPDDGLRDIWKAPRRFQEQLKIEAERFPADVEDLSTIQTLIDKKLFHQFTDKVIFFIEKNFTASLPAPSSEKSRSVPPFADTALFILLPHFAKLSSARVVSLLWNICDHIDKFDSLRLLEGFGAAVNAQLGAYNLFLILKAKCLIEVKEIQKAETMLQDIGKCLDETLGVPVEVRSAFHRTFASLYKVTGLHDSFYNHAQLYLAYTPFDCIKAEERLLMAVDISVAALMAEDVHSFGELLQQPILSSLENTPNEWLIGILYAFREGDLMKFESLWQEKQQQIQDIKELADNSQNLRRKLTILAFLELCFKCPKEKMSFSMIAEHCNVTLSEVELVAMRSMGKNLVKGTIDEVDRSISISWVKPRILDTARLHIMSERLENWATSAEVILNRLESASPDLFVSSSLA